MSLFTRTLKSTQILMTSVLLSAAVVSTTGCKNNASSAAEAGEQAVDISRIVSINGATTEILVELGLKENIIGIDLSSTYPEDIKSLPQVGYYRNLSDEGVIGLNPSFIIGETEAGPAAVVERLRRSGIPVTLLPLEISLEGALTRMQAVADAVGKSEEGKTLVERVNRELEEALTEPGPAGDVPPRVLGVYARGAGLSLVAGYGTPYDVLIKLSGATNAVSEFETFQPLTPEAVATSNADVILITKGGLAALGGVEGLLAVNGIAQTPAGKNRRIVEYDDLLLNGLGPRLPQLVKDFRRQLHEFFPGEPAEVVPAVEATVEGSTETGEQVEGTAAE